MEQGGKHRGGQHTCTGTIIWALEVMAIGEALEIHPAWMLLDELATRRCTCAMTNFWAGRVGGPANCRRSSGMYG